MTEEEFVKTITADLSQKPAEMLETIAKNRS
jgi:hypothetical protein